MMKRLKYLTLATLVAFAACDEGEDPTGAGAVGTVTVSVTAGGENVNGATVTLTGESTQSMTTANGSATFSNVVAGTYVVSLSGFGEDYVFGNTTSTVTINTDGQQATVSFSGNIVRTASISGQVTARGTGVEGVVVQISGGGDNITETKQTNAGGSYSFTGLRSGEYTVSITAPEGFEFPETSATVNLSAGESEIVNFSGSGGADATISIQSITQGGGPINLSNVFGQIEVTVNLERGGQQVQEIDVLVDGEVVATQVLTPASELEAEQVLETLTLNVATDQIEMAENGWVPVIFNGGAFISANAWVAGETAPIPSNEVPVVMNNPDKILMVDDALTPDTPEPSITVEGDTWMTGGANFAGLNYLAYSGIMPDDVTWPTEAGICDEEGTLTGTPTTGIAITNAYDCDGDEGPVRPDADDIDVDTDLDGPDGTPVQPADGEEDYVRRGAQFTLGHAPGDAEAETRHFIVQRDPDFDELFLDNKGPYVCIDGEGSVPDLIDDPDGDCQAVIDDEGELVDDVINLRVAFRDLFDEWWVNAEHEFAAPVVVLDDIKDDAGAPVHGNDVHAFDMGVGMFLDLQDVSWGDGEDMSDLWAKVWDEDGDDDTNDCVGPDVRVGGDLDPTITSDEDFGHLLCGAAADALGNTAIGEQPSNYFGADFQAPEVRLAGSEDVAPDLTAPTQASPEVDEDLDVTIHNIAGADGEVDNGEAFTNDGQWGLEAIDDRAGFDQNLLYDNYTGDHFPVYQQLLAVDKMGWFPIGTFVPNVEPETYSCGDFNAEVNAGANGLYDDGLADDFVRTTVGLTANLNCDIDMPKYLRYLGWVVDRAGNFSEMLEYNLVVDNLEPAVISAVGFGQTIYQVGEDAPFAVFGQDDLEVIGGNVALEYPSTEEADNMLLDFGDFPLGEPWGDLYSDEDDAIDLISQSVTGQSVTLPGNMVLGRIDFTEGDNTLIADAGDPGLEDDFNGKLPGDDEDFLAQSVTASLVDVGLNDPTTTASQGFIPAQWGGGVPAPWQAEDFMTWALEQNADGDVIARHRASSSVIEPVFAEVWLVLNFNDGDGLAGGTEDTLMVCNVVDGDDARIQDTGLLRIYLYDLFEIPLDDDDEVDLDEDDPCETPPVGATFHAFGILDDAALATQPYTFVVPTE